MYDRKNYFFTTIPHVGLGSHGIPVGTVSTISPFLRLKMSPRSGFYWRVLIYRITFLLVTAFIQETSLRITVLWWCKVSGIQVLACSLLAPLAIATGLVNAIGSMIILIVMSYTLRSYNFPWVSRIPHNYPIHSRAVPGGIREKSEFIHDFEIVQTWNFKNSTYY